MNQQPIKRRNPFEVPKVVEEEKVPNIIENEVEEEPAYESPKRIVQQVIRQQNTQRQQKQSSRQQYYIQEDVNREKYTSTMDITLRRQIKIACATRGIMFAKFVEDACREKLQREGGR